MKVNVVSPSTKATPKQILDFLSTSDALLTILPGNPTKPGNPGNHPAVEEVMRRLQNDKYVFMEFRDELGKWPAIVSHSDIIKMPKQLFSQNPSRADIEKMINIWPERTKNFLSGGKNISITFIICGEINGFNPDGKLKSNFGYPFPTTILANPCHTLMGRWHVLNEKLENLSIGSKMIYVTNNTGKSSKITTNLRIYEDGRRVEVRRSAPGLTWAQIEM